MEGIKDLPIKETSRETHIINLLGWPQKKKPHQGGERRVISPPGYVLGKERKKPKRKTTPGREPRIGKDMKMES